MSDRALEVIIRYERAAQHVALLRKQIGEAINRCSVSEQVRELHSQGNYREADKLVDGLREKTHLYLALTAKEPCDSGYGEAKLDEYGVQVWLEDDGCEHCIEAWRLICERRQARAEYGIAKRAIRAVGRGAIRRTTNEERRDGGC